MKPIYLHKLHFNDVLFIGWDLMINCNDNKVYCLEGNLLSLIWPDYIKNDQLYIIEDFKQKTREFYKLKSI